MTSSESPTHPDAPRAGGETPTPQERYERLLAEKLKWFEEAAASDRALHALTDDATLSEALGEIRHFAPAAMHWALNLAMSRLLARHWDGERDTPAASQETDEERALQWYANAANIVAIPSTDVPLLGLFAREILRLRKERDEANACAERWMDELNPSASPDPERASK